MLQTGKLLFPGMQKVDFSAPGLERTQLTPPPVKAQAIAPLPWGQQHPQLLPGPQQKRRNELSPNQEARKLPTAGQRSQGPLGPDHPTPCHPWERPFTHQAALPATSRPLQILAPQSEQHHYLQLSIYP